MKPYTTADAEADLGDAVAREDWRVVELLADQLDRLSPQQAATLHGAALWYVHVGLKVFPIVPFTKKPFRKTKGLKDATDDPEQVRRWWTEHPAANIGIATGHVIDVVDFDGPEAHAAWGRTFGAGWAGLKLLATVSTPRPGGMHLWVPAMPGHGNGAKKIGALDYRGRGGYVLAPPSELDSRPGQHPGRYTFLRKPTPEDFT